MKVLDISEREGGWWITVDCEPALTLGPFETEPEDLEEGDEVVLVLRKKETT